jgi:predicted ATPase
MEYKYSKVDSDNLNWFKNDNSKGTLISIRLKEGHLRGLYPFKMTFEYPISVIAGKNGVGKSTILAMAACAFHNNKNGFKLPQRKSNYYTFSDFFIQTGEEVPPGGITINYEIFYNNWRKSSHFPDGKGVGMQSRKKRAGGKWNDYSTRVNRNVVYYGIGRIVPHYEISVSKSYRNHFHDKLEEGWEKRVQETVGRILNKTYSSFWYKEHSKYRLPIVECGEDTYSGFNMGAGENALFEIFSTIYSCPPGVLLAIDEIELGLHEEAQRRLIDELKIVCLERKVQIICTTHSYIVMSAVPPEARFFIENFSNKTVVTSKISPLYAAGKLSGENSNEIDIFVEDTIAKTLLELSLTNETRTRVNILPIGSPKAIANQLAARYKNIKVGECAAVLDGDQRTKGKQIFSEFLSSLETVKNKTEAEKWFFERLNFLPGEVWPEKWIIEQAIISNKDNLVRSLSLDEDMLEKYLDEALRAHKHDEFYTLSKKANLDKNAIINFISKHVIESNINDFSGIENSISTLL